MKNWSGNNDEFIEKKLNKLFISRPWYELTLENIDNYLLADLPDLIEISSTVVRNMLSVNKNVNAIITAEISEYIQNNNISYM